MVVGCCKSEKNPTLRLSLRGTKQSKEKRDGKDSCGSGEQTKKQEE
jgi:hypothetical protein